MANFLSRLVIAAVISVAALLVWFILNFLGIWTVRDGATARYSMDFMLYAFTIGCLLVAYVLGMFEGDK